MLKLRGERGSANTPEIQECKGPGGKNGQHYNACMEGLLITSLGSERSLCPFSSPGFINFSFINFRTSAQIDGMLEPDPARSQTERTPDG